MIKNSQKHILNGRPACRRGSSARRQEGYGAFSYSKSHVTNVISYIDNQETHHHKQPFIEEYKDLLRKFEIEYNEQYIFKSLD